MPRSIAADERSIGNLQEALERLESPETRFHVRQAIQHEMAAHER